MHVWDQLLSKDKFTDKKNMGRPNTDLQSNQHVSNLLLDNLTEQ